MTKLFIVALCFLFFRTVSAEESVPTREAGIYQRSSVGFLNTLIDDNNLLTNRQWRNHFVTALQNSVRFPRFDYNNIPQNIVAQFSELPSSMSIEERMNATIVPAVLAAVEAEKEIRAMALLSEQQRNSFITDKARELGITEAELNQVMNSAFIFAPVLLNFRDTIETRFRTVTTRNLDGSTTRRQVPYNAYVVRIRGGGYWWRIDNTGETPSVKIIEQIISTGAGAAEVGTDGYRNAAFRGAVASLAGDMEMATKSISYFQLTAQVLNRTPRTAVISIGNHEGVKTDDKFRIYNSIEDSQGNITERRSGWVMVSRVGERARGLDSTQSQVQIISGTPRIGSVVREIPHLPIDVRLGWAKSPISIDDKGRQAYNKEVARITAIAPDTLSKLTSFQRDSLQRKYMGDIVNLKLTNMMGPSLKTNINIGRGAGIPQLWASLGGEFLFGGAEGEFFFPQDLSSWHQRSDLKCNISSTAIGFNGVFSIVKKFFVRRLVLAPELGFGVKGIFIFPTEASTPVMVWGGDKVDITLSQISMGLAGNMGVEFALSPLVHLGGSAGYHLYGNPSGAGTWASSWSRRRNSDRSTGGPDLKTEDTTNFSGMTWSAYVSFAIPWNR